MCALCTSINFLLLEYHFYIALDKHEAIFYSLCHQSYKYKPKALFKCKAYLAKKEIRISSN